MAGRWFRLALCLAVAAGCHRATRVESLEGTVFDAARPVDYKLYPGDRLLIRYPTDPALDQQVLIRSDGKISLPYTGEVAAGGRSPQDLEAELNERSLEVLKTPSLAVLVVEEVGRRVYVGGEVQRPGVLALDANQTLVQALYQAGGLTDKAEARQVLVLRGSSGGLVHALRVNLPRVLGGKDPDIRLEPSDIIHAPPSGIALAGRFMEQYVNALIPRVVSFPFTTYVNTQKVEVFDHTGSSRPATINR